MITEFKIFERVSWNKDDGPKIGDYVYCNIAEDSDEDQLKTDNFLRNNFGILINIDTRRDSGVYKIEFNKRLEYDVNNQLAKGFEQYEDVVYFYPEEIVLWADTKEELELKIDAEKYNL